MKAKKQRFAIDVAAIMIDKFNKNEKIGKLPLLSC